MITKFPKDKSTCTTIQKLFFIFATLINHDQIFLLLPQNHITFVRRNTTQIVADRSLIEFHFGIFPCEFNRIRGGQSQLFIEYTELSSVFSRAAVKNSRELFAVYADADDSRAANFPVYPTRGNYYSRIMAAMLVPFCRRGRRLKQS